MYLYTAGEGKSSGSVTATSRDTLLLAPRRFSFHYALSPGIGTTRAPHLLKTERKWDTIDPILLTRTCICSRAHGWGGTCGTELSILPFFLALLYTLLLPLLSGLIPSCLSLQTSLAQPFLVLIPSTAIVINLRRLRLPPPPQLSLSSL